MLFTMFRRCVERTRRHSRKGSRSQRHWNSLQLEPLESRRVLSGNSSVPILGELLGTELDTTSKRAPFVEQCTLSRDESAPTYRLPAPVVTDFSLDGAFTSDDFITYFREVGPHTDYFSNESFSVLEMFALAKSMQFVPYEVEGNSLASAPCLLQHLSQSTSTSDFVNHVENYPGSDVPQTMVTYIGEPETVRYRSALHFDVTGNLRTSSLDVYLPDSSTIYARSQTEYDESGRIGSYATWVYDDANIVRRQTTTIVIPNGEQVFQSTDVTYFDGPNVPAFRQVHYYDRDGDRLAKTDYYFSDDGRVSTRVLSQYDELGSVRYRTTEHHPEGYVPSDSGGYSQLGYLAQLHDAYRSVTDRLAPAYVQIQRMNVPDSFRSLRSIADRAGLTNAEYNHYVKLRSYYQYALDIANSLQDDSIQNLIYEHRYLVDQETGQFKDWFLKFMEDERLTRPVEPLRLTSSPHGMEPTDLATLSSQYLESIGNNPQAYFQELQSAPEQHVLDILESMRRVKVKIRLLELGAGPGGETAVFDHIAISDKPEMSDFGIEPFKLLTGHYFFEKDENGAYIRDNPSERIIRERVEKLDDDLFYAMNLEHWPIEMERSEDEIRDSLDKLKRTADWLHKYNPNLMIGFYRLMPLRELVKAYQGEGTEAHAEWQRRNDVISEALGNSVDVLFPSVYVVHLGEEGTTTEERWADYVGENIREAERIADGKPLLTFSALYYHSNAGGNQKGWQWLEPELVLFQLMYLRKHVDGIVLYNDLRTSWQAIEDQGIAEALQIFQHAKETGTIDQLSSFYDALLEENREELSERLELEKSVIDLRLALQNAERSGDSGTAARLRRELQTTQARIDGMLSLWDELKTFLHG